jgi:imidazolonepropionase-like amidohydrolase
MHETLMAGFTSVRDVGSYATEVAPLVEKGLILGPNIFGAGAAIGITSGSCDACTLPADYVYSRQGGGGGGTQDFWPGVSILAIADGVDECRRAVRQQIRRGASCIKIVTTGGILSRTDDPHCRQYSDAELAVMIEEASLHNRAVAAHAHGKPGIMAAVKAGAHTIEHGSYLDDEAAELMVKHNTTFISTRYVLEANLKQLDSLNPETAEKMVGIAKVHLEAYRTAVRHGVKIALGTDIAGSDPTSLTVHGQNGHEVALAVKAGLTPLQAIDAGTINSAETLGRLTPQKGLVRVGWDADLIALDEDPLENIHLFDSEKNIKYVWKGGMLVKSPTGQMIWPPKRGSYK